MYFDSHYLKMKKVSSMVVDEQDLAAQLEQTPLFYCGDTTWQVMDKPSGV